MNTKKSYRANRKKNISTIIQSENDKLSCKRAKRAGYTRNQLNKRKENVAIMHGGKCVMCGYQVNIAALEFHHVETKTRKTMVFAPISEYEKCVLLCANCHREHHNGGMKY